MKPNLQVNLWAFLYRLWTHVWLDLCFMLFDNALSEKKSTLLVFFWSLMYNNNSSMIINVNSLGKS